MFRTNFRACLPVVMCLSAHYRGLRFGETADLHSQRLYYRKWPPHVSREIAAEILTNRTERLGNAKLRNPGTPGFRIIDYDISSRKCS